MNDCLLLPASSFPLHIHVKSLPGLYCDPGRLFHFPVYPFISMAISSHTRDGTDRLVHKIRPRPTGIQVFSILLRMLYCPDDAPQTDPRPQEFQRHSRSPQTLLHSGSNLLVTLYATDADEACDLFISPQFLCQRKIFTGPL